MSSDPVATFESARPRLLGLAYRMLGVLADAEDVVQEAWLRWSAADQESIESPAAWLTTVTTRLSLDHMRADRRRREDYVGPWLPEPVVLARGPEDQAELADSLTLGFLTLLDRLSPVERAVLLLADVFAIPYAEVAATVGKSEVACRQIASRARRRLRQSDTENWGSSVRNAGLSRPRSDERRVVDELLVAFALGDVDAALAHLAPDVVSISDGGPERRAARHPVVGAERVARFFMNLTRRHGEGMTAEPAVINGDPGVIIRVHGDIDLVAAFEVEEDRVAAIWLVRNPEKLEHVTEPVTLS
jgi:RNA polymerase sigma-70 factor (ECF subfamily)